MFKGKVGTYSVFSVLLVKLQNVCVLMVFEMVVFHVINYIIL